MLDPAEKNLILLLTLKSLSMKAPWLDCGLAYFFYLFFFPATFFLSHFYSLTFSGISPALSMNDYCTCVRVIHFYIYGDYV